MILTLSFWFCNPCSSRQGGEIRGYTVSGAAHNYHIKGLFFRVRVQRLTQCESKCSATIIFKILIVFIFTTITYNFYCEEYFQYSKNWITNCTTQSYKGIVLQFNINLEICRPLNAVKPLLFNFDQLIKRIKI